MFRHLGGKARDKILELVNKTWVDSRLPRSWKRAIIVPIAKKGKDATNALPTYILNLVLR